MNIKTICGFLTLKITLDLICEGKRLELSDSSSLESHPNHDLKSYLLKKGNRRPFDKRKTLKRRLFNRHHEPDTEDSPYHNTARKGGFHGGKGLLNTFHDSLNEDEDHGWDNHHGHHHHHDHHSTNKSARVDFNPLDDLLDGDHTGSKHGRTSFLNSLSREEPDAEASNDAKEHTAKFNSKEDVMDFLKNAQVRKLKQTSDTDVPLEKPADDPKELEKVLTPEEIDAEPIKLDTETIEDAKAETVDESAKETPAEEDDDDDDDEDALDSITTEEDISPSKKTEFREKVVDKGNVSYKHDIDGEFEGGDLKNYLKYANEKVFTNEGGSETRNFRYKLSHDPSVDWNNSGLSAAMRYLGSGYDIVFGNPLGDPVIMMDQGYRNPVMKLDWDVEYHNKDGANLKEPKGSWLRPEFSCRQSETVDHINTVDDFKRELSIDAQASYGIPYFFSFSGSTGYKNFVKSTATNKVRTYITKTYCLRYVGGIVNFNELETTDEFKKALKELPEYFDSQACTMDMFKSNEDDPMCANSVMPWIKFIKMFGTHFTTIVHLGGKITHQVQINKSDVLHMQEQGVNVDVAVKAAISPSLLDNLTVDLKNGYKNEKRNELDNFKYDKQILVIGGDGFVDSKDMESLDNWTKDLYKRPMPIKVKLESIKSLLSNQKHRESFEEALKFYSEIYGVSPDEIYKKYGTEFGIASLVQNGHQVVYSGTKSGSAVCPNKTVIIMGFTLTILKKKNFIGKNEFSLQISHCPVGEEKCIVSNDNQGAESRIWAVCGPDIIPLLNQQTAVRLDEPATATCPTGYSIAYGFGFSIPKGNVALLSDSYACRPGTQACTHESVDKTATNAVWVACVENGAPQLSDISNHMISTSSRQCSSKTKDNKYEDIVCPVNSKLIAGWSIDFSESDNHKLNKVDKCSKNAPGCRIDRMMLTENQCRSHYSWISCLHEKESVESE